MNTLGKNLRLSIFGESHSELMGATLDGLCAGIKIDYDFINECLEKRRPNGPTETQRKEKDDYKIISGVFNGYSTGEPITILIKNEEYNSSDYSLNKDKPRPSHADYVKFIKEDGYNDYRGGGASSARLTAPIVALGSIVLKALEDKGIEIESHIKSLGSYNDSPFDMNNIDEDFKKIRSRNKYPLIVDFEAELEKYILSFKESNDSIGGTIETCIKGLDAGVGEPWFDSMEGKISNAMFSIPGIKGIEFGLGFKFAETPGSMANDEFVYENGRVMTLSNNNGGINGGISNGMPIVFKVAIRPTSSISSVQNTINLSTKTNDVIEIKGRHDPSIVRRSVIIVKVMTALSIADLLIEKEGRNILK